MTCRWKGSLRRSIVGLGSVLVMMLAAADAAQAAPYVRFAHFTSTAPNEFSAGSPEFGPTIDISVANRPARTAVCVSGSCRRFPGGEIHGVTAGVFGQVWKRGQTRTVAIFACNLVGCMPRPWSARLTIP